MPVEHNMHLIESPTIHGHNLLPSLSPVNVNLLFQLNCLKLMSPLMGVLVEEHKLLYSIIIIPFVVGCLAGDGGW